MEKQRNVFWNRAVSLMMAAVMLFAAVLAAPGEAKAAEYTFNGTGISEVVMTDAACKLAVKNKQFHWIRFTPKKTGTVTVSFAKESASAGNSNGYIVLCNAAKQFLDYTPDYFTTAKPDDGRYYNITYGVRAKTTYYFRVESSAGIRIKATVSTVKKNAAGKTRKKAKTLARNQTVKGVILAGDSQKDWFKLKLSKRKRIRLECAVQTNGWDGQNVDRLSEGIRFTFYNTRGVMFSEDAYIDLDRAQTKYTMDFYMIGNGGKNKKKLGLIPGTYFIKVERRNKYSSGGYSMKWKMF